MENQAKNLSTLLLFLLLFVLQMEAQVGVNNTNSDPDPSAMLDVQSTDKGLLMPRMTTDERDAISNPVAGLMIYNVEDSCFNYYSGLEWVVDCGRDLSINNFLPQSAGGVLGVNTFDRGQEICTDSEGNIIMTGYYTNNITFGSFNLNSTGPSKLFLTKYNSQGDIVWATGAEGTGEVNPFDVAADSAGNIFVIGEFSGMVSFDNITLIGQSDMFVAKYNAFGQAIWVIKADGVDLQRGQGVSTGPNGSIYVSGSFIGDAYFESTTLTSQGLNDGFVAKYNSLGQLQWAKSFGGNDNDFGIDISTDQAGNSYVVGEFNGNMSVGSNVLNNSGSSDVFIAKYDPNGQILWATKFGSTSYENISGISVDSIGNSYITGRMVFDLTFGSTTLTSSGVSSIFVAKINPLGQPVWATKPGGGQNHIGNSISIDQAGNSYITGEFSGTIHFGSDTLKDGGILAIKIDSSGQFLWATKAGAEKAFGDVGNGIATNADGNCFITGYFEGAASFGDITLTSNSATDVFLWPLLGKNGKNLTIDLNLSNSQDGDTDPENEIQTLTISGSNLSISDGNSVDISNIDTDTDDQTLTLLGPNLSISDGNSIDLSSIDTDTDDQTLSLNGSNLSIEDGNSIDISSIDTDTDDQALSLNGSNLSIEDGNSIDISSIDTDTDDQTLSLNGSNLSIEDGNSIDISSIDTDTDDQALSLNGSNLSIEDGNSIDISSIDTDTDDQALSLNGSNLSIEDGNSIDISSIDTDNQAIDKLNLNGTILELSLEDDGQPDQTLDLALVGADNLGNHTASQNLELQGNWFSNDGDNEGIYINNAGRVGIGMTNPNQPLSVNGHAELNREDPQLIFKDETGGESRASSIQTFMVPGGSTEQQEMQFHVSNNASNGSRLGMKINGLGQVGFGNMDGKIPSAALHLEKTNPNIRLVDERSQASGTGNVLGTLEWYSRDASNSPAFQEVAAIEVVNVNGSASPDTRMEFVVWEDGSTGSFKRNPLSLWPNGNVAVGDGTSAPTKAKMEIVGSGSSYTVSGQSRYYGSGGDNSNSNYSSTFSLYAAGNIAANAFVAHSDARIKDIQGLSNSETDLTTLMEIEVTDYTMKDSIAKGHTPYKKVIAQQVAEVYPQAVTKSLTEAIPDIYQRAEIKDGWIMLATDLAVGERVKIITEQKSNVYDVLEVHENRFKVNLQPTANGQIPTAFVFGREVNDFHTVDYEALSMLNVSATQQQQKRIEVQEEKIKQQRKMIEQLKRENKTMKVSFETRLQALEALLNNSTETSPTKK